MQQLTMTGSAVQGQEIMPKRCEDSTGLKLTNKKARSGERAS